MNKLLQGTQTVPKIVNEHEHIVYNTFLIYIIKFHEKAMSISGTLYSGSFWRAKEMFML